MTEPRESLRKIKNIKIEAQVQEDKLSSRVDSDDAPTGSENNSQELAWMLARLELIENEIDHQFNDDKEFGLTMLGVEADLEPTPPSASQPALNHAPSLAAPTPISPPMVDTTSPGCILAEHVRAMDAVQPKTLSLDMVIDRHRGLVEELLKSGADSPDLLNSTSSSSTSSNTNTPIPTSTSTSTSTDVDAVTSRTLQLSVLCLDALGVSAVGGLELFARAEVIMLQRNAIQSMHGFPPLASLRVLALAQNNISNAFLPFLPSLTSLYLDHNPITTLPQPTSLPCLAALSLSHTPLASLEPLRHYASTLRRLNIANTRVTDLSLLSHFTHLTHLTCDNCRIDARSLACLPPSLTHLSLQQCQLIGDATTHTYIQAQSPSQPLALTLPPLPRLTHLSLAWNPLSIFPDLQYCPELRYVDLSYTRITNVHGEYVPDDIQIVKIAGSPCARDEITRILLVASLPLLTAVDDVAVTATEREEAIAMVEEVFGAADDDEDEQDAIVRATNETVSDGAATRASTGARTSIADASEGFVEKVDLDGGFFTGTAALSIFALTSNSLNATTRANTDKTLEKTRDLNIEADMDDDSVVDAAEAFLSERALMREFAVTAHKECRDGIAQELCRMDEYATERLGLSLNGRDAPLRNQEDPSYNAELVYGDGTSGGMNPDAELAHEEAQQGNRSLLDKLIQQSRDRVSLLQAMGNR